ncbi:MAG: hypothetical protein HC925_05915 [Coleofasciculaceae cyanobacterium SM2_3_26]|nr:hypothetical protein [Coleofasciculaceae cyanobacterium SM2_3_26]
MCLGRMAATPPNWQRDKGKRWMAAGLLPQEDLLDYVRRTVRSTEALTMFAAKLMYLFVPAVDSLFLGCSDTPDNWKFHWDDVTPEQLAFWEEKGLSDRQIYLLHKQHRLDMARLRQIFLGVHHCDPRNSLKPATEVSIHHTDSDRSVLALWRYNSASPYESLLIVFNWCHGV